MRADRLLALLMLLQARGQMTAQQLSAELEVSERTIYRDIDALCVAGVPIYADHGPGGGYALLDSYRTNLTGLNESEVRALFMLSIPAPLADLGVRQELRAALLKLSAALPATRRQDEEQVRQRIHLDSVGWFQVKEPVPHLSTIQQALWQDRVLQLTFHASFDTEVEQRVAPYGLVAKTSIWYLVYARNGYIRPLRVSRVLDARLSDETFERPADFDLVAYWQAWCTEVEENRERYRVTVRVSPKLAPLLPHYFDHRIHEVIAQAGPADADGWLVLTLSFETLEDARERILGFGRAAEVLRPRALRESVRDYAAQVVDLYGRREEV